MNPNQKLKKSPTSNMDKKSLKEKLLKGAKDQNCKVVTSTAFSEVSINKQKN